MAVLFRNEIRMLDSERIDVFCSDFGNREQIIWRRKLKSGVLLWARPSDGEVAVEDVVVVAEGQDDGAGEEVCEIGYHEDVDGLDLE